MKGKVSWVPNSDRISYSQAFPPTSPKDTSESVALLNRRQRKRCCFGSFRVHGSDGVWAWCVALSNFLINFIIVGLGRMSGIFYVEFMDMFNIGRETASIPFSVQQAGRNLFGLVAGILGEKYGLRTVTVLGGIIGSLSAVIAYFRMDITSITILWGLFFGISTALTTTLSQVSIDQYFEKYRATAGGFAFSGGCVGAFFFPVVIEILISHYGMKGTFLVLGGIISNVVPAALLLAEPPWKKNIPDRKAYEENIKQYGSFTDPNPEYSLTNVLKEKPNNQSTGKQKSFPSAAGIDFDYLQTNSDLVYRFLTLELYNRSRQNNDNQIDLQSLDKMRLLNEIECIYSAIVEQEEKLKAQTGTVMQIPKSESFNGAIPKKKLRESLIQKEHGNDPRRVYIENKLQELYETRGTKLISHFPYPDQARACKVLIELRKLFEKLMEEPSFQIVCNDILPSSTVVANTEAAEEPLEVKLDPEKPDNSFCDLMKTAARLHGNPLFLLICVCRGVFMLTFIPVVTIIVDYAMDKGMPKSDGKYVIAALSLGDFFGRLCFGWITDRKCLSLPRYMFLVMILLAGSTATIPCVNSKSSLLGAVLFFAMLQGSLFVKHPLLVSDYVKEHEKSIAMGFINFLSGILGFTLPAFIGYFRDVIGSYDKMFYVNGGICAAVGFVWLLEPFLIKFSSARPEKT